jgi:hypothetical protein
MEYRPRVIEPILSLLFAHTSAILLTGPRSSGKSTTASRYVATTVRLDHEPEAAAFRIDPDAVLATLKEPVLLDEWQEVPEVLGAVKRAISRTPRPGRFFLTSSVNADLEANIWPGTGRIIRVSLFGMTIREQLGDSEKPTFIDRLIATEISLPSQIPDLAHYVDLALRGGFPDCIAIENETVRRRWLESYVDQIVTRDVQNVQGNRDPIRVRRFLQALALNSAGIPANSSIWEAAGVSQKTAEAYEHALSNLYVLDSLPAWRSNRLKRLTLRSKRYLVDAGILGALINIDVAGVLQDGDVLGRIIDTFIASQIRSEIGASPSHPRLFHLRDGNGRHEVDILAELSGQKVVAFESKSMAAPSVKDATHLRWLRDQIGDRFVRGVIFHSGPAIYELDERILAVPICALWG